MVIVVSGPGGVGKGTIAQSLVDSMDNLWLSKSWTTRPIRDGENPDSYVFVTREQFESSIESGEFLEWAEFQGNLYGTPLPEAPDGMHILLEIDVQGASSIIKKAIPALLIFVDAPSVDDQARRLRGRGDPEVEVEKRILKGERERRRAKELGAHVIINDDLERTIQEIRALIERQANGHQR